MKGIGGAVSFVVGVIAGGVAVHYFEKKKNEAWKEQKMMELSQYYLEEIQNVMDGQSHAPTEEPATKMPDPEPEVEEDPVEIEAATIIENYGSETMPEKAPYPIPAQQFGKTGNEEIMLTYYADGVLVDDGYRVVPEDDILDFVGGRNFVKWFGEYGEMGTIHIRNDRLNSDFEIDQDPRNWRDFKKSLPNFPTGKSPYDDDPN